VKSRESVKLYPAYQFFIAGFMTNI